MSDYFLYRNDQQEGPFQLGQLQAMQQSGNLRPEDLVWTQGMNGWQAVSQTTALFEVPKAGMGTSKKVLLFGALGCGGLITLFLAMAVLSFFMSSTPSTGTRGYSGATVRVEDMLQAQCQQAYEQQKQVFFNALHPIGTAKRLEVHNVHIDQWSHGIDTNNLSDVKQFTVRFTLYWEGPIEKDGFTKVSQTFDTESGRYISGQILATNGTTNADVGNALGYMAGSLLRDALGGN